MSADLITIRNLHVTLGDKQILRGINAGLNRGKITALIGLNGSGKTTLLKAILKEVPYTGEIKFHCGHDHTQPLPHHIGYVPQKLAIDAKLPLTVRDLFALALQKRPLFLGISKHTNAIMKQLLERVWAPLEILDRLVEKLSPGQLQRVLLALALYPEPELLLLDEPAAGVDFLHEEKFYDLISRLNAEFRVTIVLVSHELSLVTRHAHHVLCLRDGTIHCQGPPQEISSLLQQTYGSEMKVFAHKH